MLAELVVRFAAGLWELFVESSLYILGGFAIAGLLHVWVPETFIRRVLGHGRIGSIFTAALLGIPLPLCSCSVLPTAIAMRRMGASRGATVSYLISEPETGPDSIAITYGLMGPLIAVYRPAAALAAAMIAGLLVEWRGGPDVAAAGGKRSDGESTCEEDGCHDPGERDHEHLHDHAHGQDHGHDHGHDHAPALDAAPSVPFVRRAHDWRGWVRGALRYGFVDLLDDLSHWLLLGLVIGALVTAFVPATAIGAYLGQGLLPLVAMALIGVPIYICAAASTPIAAALVLKGLSPGAALVLLLTGPATNLGSIAVLVRQLGRRVVAIYLVVVVVVSIAAGAALDALYAALGTRPEIRFGGEPGWLPAWVWSGAAVLLAALLARSILRAPLPGEFRAIGRSFEHVVGVRVTRARVTRSVAAVGAAAWLSTSVTVVEPGERGVRLTLGRPSAELAPGLHVGLPAPLARTVVVPTHASRVVELTAAPAAGRPARSVAGDRYFLTGDRDLIEVDARVEYRSGDAARFALAVIDPEALVRATARAVLIDEIGRTRIDDLYTSERAAVERRVAARLGGELDRLGAGVTIDRVAVQHVRAPERVIDAFRDIASAREDAATAVEVARGERDAALSRARGDAATLAAESAAARFAEVARAGAEGYTFALQAAALGDWRMLAERRMWLETAEVALAGKTKIVREGGAGPSALDVWIGGAFAMPPVSSAAR